MGNDITLYDIPPIVPASANAQFFENFTATKPGGTGNYTIENRWATKISQGGISSVWLYMNLNILANAAVFNCLVDIPANLERNFLFGGGQSLAVVSQYTVYPGDIKVGISGSQLFIGTSPNSGLVTNTLPANPANPYNIAFNLFYRSV